MQLPPCYLPQKIVIYKIPICNCNKYVFMKDNSEFISNYKTIFIITDKFLKIWNDCPKFNDFPLQAGIPYASMPELWMQDRKLTNGKIDKYFSEGIINPVPLAVIDYIESGKLYLLDGITRTLWLLVHNVKIFPIACPITYSYKLKLMAGLEFD